MNFLLSHFSLISCLINFFLFLFFILKCKGFKEIGKTIIEEAEKKAGNLKEKSQKERLEEESFFQEKIKQQEKKWVRKEISYEEKVNSLQKKEKEMEKQLVSFSEKERFFLEKEEKILQKEQTLMQMEKSYSEALEKISNCSWEEAKKELYEKAYESLEKDLEKISYQKEKEMLEDANEKSTKILATSIQRLALSVSNDLTTDTIYLNRDDLKARIIGREGRNIRTLERCLGVNLLMDELPSSIVLSGFDPIRKMIAKKTIQKLTSEKRVYPERIEEIAEEQAKEFEKDLYKIGEDAASRVGAIPIHRELAKLLGSLKFRQSLGQNLLDHSLEVSHLLGLMALELQLDVRLAKRIGLLHDIGKAVSHEYEKSHAKVGFDLALQYGEAIDVANGIGCHHFEIEPITIEGSLCHSADAISASRQAARSESLHEHLRRLHELEKITSSFKGVEKSYCMQAGKEIVVIVSSENVNDERMRILAREITKKIEQELKIPGKIKVTVIREKRVTHYAS